MKFGDNYLYASLNQEKKKKALHLMPLPQIQTYRDKEDQNIIYKKT